MNNQELIEKAIAAWNYSYSPYSKFKVGAALLTKEGKLYTGCNIENAGYSATNCAERTAFFKAVSEGEDRFAKIAIVAAKDGEAFTYTAPCGVCRQVMMEFCNPKTFKIILAIAINDFKEYTLEELLPMGFGPKNII
jgi:cytidine deaminase